MKIEKVYSFDKEDGNHASWVVMDSNDKPYITVRNSPGEKFTLFLHKANDGKDCDVTLDKKCIPQLELKNWPLLLLEDVNCSGQF